MLMTEKIKTSTLCTQVHKQVNKILTYGETLDKGLAQRCKPKHLTGTPTTKYQVHAPVPQPGWFKVKTRGFSYD